MCMEGRFDRDIFKITFLSSAFLPQSAVFAFKHNILRIQTNYLIWIRFSDMALTARDQQRQTLEHFLLVENCLIAELHRLSSISPREFFLNERSTEKITRLIVDFSYFENPRIIEELLEKNEVSGLNVEIPGLLRLITILLF